MDIDYKEPEDLLSDESFLAWHFKTDPDGAVGWEQWMSGRPERRILVSQAVSLLEEVRIKEEKMPEEQVFTAENRLLSGIEESGEKPRARVFSLSRRFRWIGAASVVFLLLAGYFIARHGAATLPGIKTAYGEVKKQDLPDGSEVFMNANSEVSYSKGWHDGKDREVWISGEAFFHVRKTPLKSRFIVHADRFDIIVTGTQFNVLNREGRASVMLKEGSVTIHTQKGKEMIMVPGDFLEYKADEWQRKTNRNDSVIAWKDKKLVFDSTNIFEVVRIIKDHYGIDIALADSLTGNRTISGILPNDNLDVLLEALEATTEFEIIRQKDKITIAAH